MDPSPLVAKSDLRAAARQVRRLGTTASLRSLERREPDLAELLMESASSLHRQLARRRLPPRLTRRLTRQVEALGLTLGNAVLIAHARRQRPVLPIPP